LELEKSEARKLMKLRDDRIAQLDGTCRKYHYDYYYYHYYYYYYYCYYYCACLFILFFASSSSLYSLGGMTENMMSQSIRHESEISKLRESETAALKRLNELLIEKDGDLAELAASPVHVTSPPPPNFHHKKVHGNVSIRGGGSSSSSNGEQKNSAVPKTPSPNKRSEDTSKGKSSGSRFFGRLRFF
jgi:hypothetical protein